MVAGCNTGCDIARPCMSHPITMEYIAMDNVIVAVCVTMVTTLLGLALTDHSHLVLTPARS